MRLSLAELQVDSYANQVSETELTAVKGGSTQACALYGAVAVVITAIATVINTCTSAANDHQECGTSTYVEADSCGTKTTVLHICEE